VESLLVENKNLHDKLKQVETDLVTNKHWNNASQALNWLSKNHSHGKKGFGFGRKHGDCPRDRKYVRLPENVLCFHCGKTGHVRYTCPSRNNALKRNLGCVKQVWIRKKDLHMCKGTGPKKIWVPESNH